MLADRVKVLSEELFEELVTQVPAQYRGDNLKKVGVVGERVCVASFHVGMCRSWLPW